MNTKDKAERRPTEEKISVVDGWIGQLTVYQENGLVIIPELDRALIRDVLIEKGADFEPKPQLAKL